MEGCDGSCVRHPTGGSVIQGYSDNRRIFVRVGDKHVGQSCERHLGPEGGLDSHKRFVAFGCVPCTETFPAISPRAPCLSKDGQVHLSAVHQLPGWHSLTVASDIRHQTLVPLSKTCNASWTGMQTFCHKEPSVQGVDSPPTSGGINLKKYSWAGVELLTSSENVQCLMFRSMSDANAPLGLDALSLSKCTALCINPLSLIFPTPARMKRNHSS